MSRRVNTRIISKHDTTANWNAARGFIPFKGEIIVYEDYAVKDGVNIPNIKIGDGLAYVQDLPFVHQDIRDQLLQHVEDLSIHVTEEQRTAWSNKVNINDSYDILYDELEDGNLIFSRTYNGGDQG